MYFVLACLYVLLQLRPPIKHEILLKSIWIDLNKQKDAGYFFYFINVKNYEIYDHGLIHHWLIFHHVI